ncbi:MAG: hypothetical protein R3B99_21925 [Polyangiales bacterium]
MGARASATLALASHEENRTVGAAAFGPRPGPKAFEDRWRLAKAAAFLPRETTEAWITALLGAEEWMLRREALLVVSVWAADESVRALVRGHLEDPYPRVRAAAVARSRGSRRRRTTWSGSRRWPVATNGPWCGSRASSR